MKKKEILDLLAKEDCQKLLEQAYQAKLSNLGAVTYLRALLEYSNFCSGNCYYCGIRAENSLAKRFEIPMLQMQENIRKVHQQGYASFLIQSGERNQEKFVDNINKLIKYAKKVDPNFRIVLSTGEQTKETYQKWFDSGASSYLLRIETSSKSLYQKIHPPQMSYNNRLNCIHHLQEIGYQTGSGILIGFPGLIIVRQGKGLFVRSEHKDPVLGNKVALEDKEKLWSACNLANLLECHNIVDVAANISESQIEKLEENLRKFVACTEKEVDQEQRLQKLTDIDHEFHYLLASFSTNSFLFAFLDYLFVRIKKSRRFFLGSAEKEQRMIWEHRSMVEALSKGTGIAANSLMKGHLENYLDYLSHELGDFKKK